MESLAQNKALLYSIIGSSGTVLALTLGLVPELAQQFEIIDFPPDVILSILLYIRSKLFYFAVSNDTHPNFIRRFFLFLFSGSCLLVAMRRRAVSSCVKEIIKLLI